jgi:DNA ligase D-like protein (predicted polymerase)
VRSIRVHPPASRAAAPARSGGRAATAGRTRSAGSRHRALPDFIAPQRPMPAVWPPHGSGWLYEIDFDGERVLARRKGREITLHTSSGDDCTARYPAIVQALGELDVDDAWLDGEVVTVADDRPGDDAVDQIRYALFDLMYVDGDDLRAEPLVERRARLERLLGGAPPRPLVFSGELAGDGASLLREACGLGLAGLIAKRRESPYEGGRARTWLELKCPLRAKGADTRTLPTPAQAARASPKIAGVSISHPERLITDGGGATKLDVARYYERMAPLLLPHVARRPLALVRCTGGDFGQCFFQKHMGRDQGNAGDPEDPYVLLPTLKALIEAVQNGVFELHTWGSSLPRIDRPDRITLDLDPDVEVAWPAFREATEHVRALLDDLGLRWFLKTTGGKGLHFVLPIERRYTWDEAKDFAGSIARHLAGAKPDVFTATMSKIQRSGRVFVDYLRNAEGATAVAAYSLRARAGLPVSMPIEWDALADDVRGTFFNWRNSADVVAARSRDPWADYDSARQRINAVLAKRLRG